VKTGEKACPFNSLYWNFYNKNEDKLAKPRIGMMYNVWNKMKRIKSGFIRTSGLLSKKINEL
jgi:deoxyribodipyrimidine photolyase-related protein